MHKSKFGISVGLLGAIICTLSLMFGMQWYVLGIMGFVLFNEENEWLKRFIVKILILTLIVWFFTAGFDILGGFLSWLNSLFGTDLSYPWSINTKIVNILIIVKEVILFIMALSALSQNHIRINPIDKIVNKNV